MTPTIPLARLVFAGLMLIIGGSATLGQTVTTAESRPSDPQLKLNPAKTLQSFEPAVNEEYTLGPGDEISLDFTGRPELGGKKVVGPDGRITLSLVGPINVADKNRGEVAKLVVGALSPYYKDLTVTVNVDKYASNRVIVLGNVKNPGVLYFDSAPTLLDVIAKAGLLGETGTGNSAGTASGASQQGSGLPERCAIYRGNDQVVWVDLRQMLQSGNSMADLRLRRNDVVFVPAQQELFVSVLGKVTHAGAVALRPDSTVVSLIAMSGGLAEGAGANIEIIQPSTGKTLFIPFKNLLTPTGNDEVKLHAGDVVYVPQSGFFKSTYVVQRLSSFAAIGAVAAIAH